MGIALTVSWADPVAAQGPGRWHVDIQAGAFIPISDVEFNDDGRHFDLDLDTGAAFTAGGGYALDRWVDFTAQFHTATHFDIYDEAVNIYSFTIGGRFFPLPMTSLARPWVGTQIGWYHVDAYGDEYDPFDDDDHEDHDGDDSFGVNAGGGIDFRVNQRVSLGVDVRYHNAFDAFQGFEFVSTMFNVSIWFGDEPGHRYDEPRRRYDDDTPPVPRNY